MLKKTYAKFYAILYFWLRLPYSYEVNEDVWKLFENEKKNSALAACSVMRTYFAPFANGLQIRYATEYAQDYLDDILNCMPLIPVKIMDAMKYFDTPLSSYGYNFLIIDGVHQLSTMKLARKTFDGFGTEQYFLISVLHYENSSEIEKDAIQKISNYFWKHLFLEVKILFSLSAAKITNLYTYRPFAKSEQCKQPIVVHLNAMHDETWLIPLKHNYSAANLTDLQGCPLKVATWHTPPYLSYYPSKSGFEQFGGFEGRLVVELAKKLNFTLKVVHPDKDELRGAIFANGTTTGAIKMLQKGEADFSLGCFRYSLDRRRFLSSLLPYYQSSQVYGIALRERRLSSTKMLAFAFDASTWFCIFLSLQIAITLAFFLYRHRKQNLLAENILGRPISASFILNLFGVILGIPMSRLPATNFTRYVIVMWYIYGVIMRTAYLSLLFKMLQNDMFLKPPRSFEDLKSEHYKLVMIEATYASTYAFLTEGNQIAKLVIQNTSDEATFDYMVQHPTEFLASVSPREFLLYYMVKTKDAERFIILPQTIFSHHVTMYLPKYSYLTRPFDYIVRNLRYNGLINYWAQQSLDLRKIKRKTEKAFKALTTTQLMGVLQLYQIFISISFVTFFLEWLCFKKKWMSS